jgi:sec-independent protein translocase protein TatC
MSAYEHWLALRKSILHAGVGVLLIFVALIGFSQSLYTWFADPLLRFLPEGGSLIATQVTAPFLVPLKLAFFIALCLGFPYVLYQLWRFIAPGLYSNEKKNIFPMICVGIALFYMGLLFAYTIVLPLIFSFTVQSAPIGVQVMTDISAYLDFVLAILFAFGICFQTPLIIVGLSRLKVINIEKLKQKRPYIIVGAFIIGMLLTPPDIFSQTLLAIPLCLLFEIGIWWASRD